jgi:aminopeptidase N
MYADQGSGDRDQAFIDMMHDFIESHHDAPASTESFKAIAEKHMTKPMDLQQNGRLDWFFNEWVYGTQIPHYSFKYDVQRTKGGDVTLRVDLTQSEVDNNFAMFVPVFADFGKGMVRLGQVALAGNSTRTVIFHVARQPKKAALNAYKDILER